MKMLMSQTLLKIAMQLMSLLMFYLMQHSSCARPNDHTPCLLVTGMQMLKLSVAAHASEESSL